MQKYLTKIISMLLLLTAVIFFNCLKGADTNLLAPEDNNGGNEQFQWIALIPLSGSTEKRCYEKGSL